MGAIGPALGSAISFTGGLAQADAAKSAGELNARELEFGADRIRQQADEDEKRFRLAIRKQEGSNVTAIAKSGIKLEGSALEVMRENAMNAETDAINMRTNARFEETAMRRQGRNVRATGIAQQQAGRMAAVGQLSTDIATQVKSAVGSA